MRTKYPGNRDIRSDVPNYDEDNNSTTSVNMGSNPKNNLVKEEPFSLWDLEREKEERDAMKKHQEQQQINEILENTENQGNTVEEKRRKRREDNGSGNDSNNDEWFLASISSTGVLMQSLNKTRSSIDFAFVLNIRESEAYPPLFKPQDLNCVEEKISAYKSKFLNERTFYLITKRDISSNRLYNG